MQVPLPQFSLPRFSPSCLGKWKHGHHQSHDPSRRTFWSFIGLGSLSLWDFKHTQQNLLVTLDCPSHQALPSLAIGPGLIGPARAEIGSGWAGLGVKVFGPGRAAKVASPGSPKKPEIKPEEMSLLFIKSQYITHIFQKCCEP